MREFFLFSKDIVSGVKCTEPENLYSSYTSITKSFSRNLPASLPLQDGFSDNETVK